LEKKRRRNIGGREKEEEEGDEKGGGGRGGEGRRVVEEERIKGKYFEHQTMSTTTTNKPWTRRAWGPLPQKGPRYQEVLHLCLLYLVTSSL
jgi:hypothetical protein